MSICRTKQTFVSENSVPDALSNFIHELCEITWLLMVSYLGKAICRIVWKNGNGLLIVEKKQ